MAEEETSSTQSMMLWQFAPSVSTAVQQQPILIAPFMAPPPLISISSAPTIQSLQQQLYQQLLPQTSVVSVQQESTQAPRPGVISPPVGKKESADSEKPIHVSVVSPVNKDSSHQWSDSSTSTPSSKQSSKTAERRRGSVIMGVGSSTHTKKSSVTTIVDKSDNKQEVTSSGDVTGSRRASGGTVKMATLVGSVGVGSSSGMNNSGVLNTTAAVVWSPPETHITSSGGESNSIIVQEGTPRLAAKTPPIHTRFPSLEPKVDLRKRRGKKPADIDAFVIPLKKGWRRETMIRSHTKADVCYTTPCGRRLRAYQEVTRYLELNHITDLTVDNFSFSTKIMVGQFLESREDGSSWRVLSDDEIASKNLTVDKRLLGCKKRKVSLDNIPNTAAGVNSVIMNNVDPSEHTQANSTHSDHVLLNTPHSNEAQAKATADPMPTSGHTPNHDHTHISTPVSSDDMRCADISQTLGPHTTIVTISPADVDEPVTNSNTVSTVYVDGPSTDDCSSASVTMPTIASPPPTKQPDSSSGVAKGLVVYPRKRGRKRKEEGGNSMPIHLPRKRGNSTSKPEAPFTKRRGRPPKVVNQSMQSMTSHFETHQPNAKKVSPSNQSTMPASSGHHGHHVPVMAGVSHSGRDHRSGKGTRSGSHHQPEYTYRAKKKLGRPRKEEVELRRKEEIRLKAEKIRRRAEKYAQSKAMKKLMKEEKLEAERQRQLVANHLAKQREQEDLQYRRSRIMIFQEQEQRRKQKDLSQNLIERNKQYIVDDKMRMEQQSLEFEIQYQLKKPIEDLELKRVLSLPTLTHIPTACLTSTAFAQVQVVYEFIAAFSEFLGFEEVPSFPVLCGSLHNVNRETFLDVFVHLLKPLLNDYGGKATVATGENLSDVELTTFTASELFRVLTNMSDEEPSDKMKVIISKLESESVSGLRPSDKAALLNYMVDTLLSSNSLVREIDSRMEMMSNLRREKWKVNLKLKKFRTVFNTEHTTAEEVAVLMKPPPYKGRGRPPKRPQIMRDNVEEDSSEEDEGQDGEEGEDPAISEETGEVSAEESDEDLPRSKDHLEGRIKQLKRKQAHIRVLLNRISTKMRSFPLGNDRYTRSYWHLPALGGLYVEGADSFPSTLSFWGPIEQDVLEEDPPIVQEDTKPSDSLTVKKELDEEDTVSGAAQSETEKKANVKCEKDPVLGLDIDKEPVPMTVSIHLPDTSVSYTLPTTSSAKDTSPNKPAEHTHPTTSTNDTPPTSFSKIGSTVDATVRPAPMKHTPSEHPLPPALVTGQGGSTDPAVWVVSPAGPLSPTSTSVMMTIHSPTGVGMVTGTMEVTPVSSTGVRSSVITSASLSGDEGAQKNKMKVEATGLSSQDKSWENTTVSSSQRSDVWFSIFPRESCSKPCDMEKLIARCTAPPGEPGTGMLESKESTQQLLPQVPAANSENTPDGDQGNSMLPMSQYSYMYVQTPEGDTQLCLVENSVMPYLQTVTLQMEVPPVVALDNESEMSPYATPITVEAGRWQTFHHNFQQMMANLEKKQFRTPSELLATVANDKKSGWWFLEKGPNVDLLLKKLSSRGYREKHLCKTLSKMKTLLTAPSEDNGPQRLKEITQSVMKYYVENGDVAMDTSEHQPDQAELSDLLLVARDDLFPEENRVQAMLVMKELKGIEERLFAANLERKGSAHPCSGLEEQLKEMSNSGDMFSAIGKSLLKLQEIVDKQYMNEPFSEASSKMDTSTANETEQQASPLDLWKIAITTATSASQLAVCMAQLDKSIAWEKSLLKVFCTHCHKADDEANLLLCDGCDRGTHTYCCKPKLANVPDGDWFCANCVSTTSISRECTVCLGRRGPFTHCTICPRVYHKKCLSSTVPNKLKGDHSRCPSCIKSASPTMHTRSRGKGRTSSPSGLRASTNSPRGRDYAGSPRTRGH